MVWKSFLKVLATEVAEEAADLVGDYPLKFRDLKTDSFTERWNADLRENRQNRAFDPDSGGLHARFQEMVSKIVQMELKGKRQRPEALPGLHEALLEELSRRCGGDAQKVERSLRLAVEKPEEHQRMFAGLMTDTIRRKVEKVCA
jgi:hypothetical protein